MEEFGHGTVVSDEVILIRFEYLGRQVPVARKFHVRFFQKFAVNQNMPIAKLDGFTGQPDDAFHVHHTRCCEQPARPGKADADDIAALGFRPQISKAIQKVDPSLVIGGQHVATLMSGQVFRRQPTERDFLMVVKMLKGGQNSDWEKKVRKTYFETPVVTADRFQAIIHLLSVFAQYLADYAGRHAIASSDNEPVPVSSAKQFVQSHVEEPITLTQVVEHVNVSRFYFCKLFKKATGMTLTEYVSRVRVEKAKTLLIDPSLRISEVVYAAGFGSIPRFNSVFKRYVGMPPTEYRATVRSQLPV